MWLTVEEIINVQHHLWDATWAQCNEPDDSTGTPAFTTALSLSPSQLYCPQLCLSEILTFWHKKWEGQFCKGVYLIYLLTITTASQYCHHYVSTQTKPPVGIKPAPCYIHPIGRTEHWCYGSILVCQPTQHVHLRHLQGCQRGIQPGKICDELYLDVGDRFKPSVSALLYFSVL